MNLKYTISGYIYILPGDDCEATVDAMLETNYDGDFCIAENFDPEFATRLMEAGFLVMSIGLIRNNEPDMKENEPSMNYVMLPKLHLVRSALFFENLHIKKSIRRLLGRYELKADADFDHIIDKCVEKHGADWLTPALVDCVKKIRQNAILDHFPSHPPNASFLAPNAGFAYPASFALYRGGKLAAGEFGIVCGNVYTSYSGFYDEDNAGTVQLILTARYLEKNGFSFFDMGMPLDYKTDLGAVDISPREFVKLFRGEEKAVPVSSS